MNRIAVLGGAGFVGSHLCEKLVKAGYKVSCFDNYERGSNSITGVTYTDIDVSNLDSLAMRLRTHQIDTVFNLAASVAGVYYNLDNQLEMFHKNAALLTVPLMAAEKEGVERFLQVSSVCVYDSRQQGGEPIHEFVGSHGKPHPANGGYAWAKRMGEEMALLSKIPHLVIVRPSNVVGPRDYFDEKAHVVPALIRRADVEGDPLNYLGQPDYIREFIHVEDVAQGMWVALSLGMHQGIYNLGSGQLIKIGELARKIADHFDIGVHWLPSEGGDPYRCSDTSKINNLGWKAEKTIDEMLEDTIKWYRARFR
jgi:GDP-L-fucose synthase